MRRLDRRTAPRRPQWGYALATLAAGVFGTLAVLFILNPAYPAQINAWLMTQPVERPSVPQSIPRNDSRPAGKDHILATEGRSGAVPAVEDDQRFLREWFSRKYPSQDFQLSPSPKQSVLSVREFTLPNGKTVLVYTHVDGEPEKEEQEHSF